LALAATTMEKTRRKLEAYPPDRIYKLDETGLLYRCLPSRSYEPRRDRRHARGTRAMRHMDRVTLVLCSNATGTHKLPVAMIGEPVSPLCFRGEGNECPLPYSNQKKALRTNTCTPHGGIRSLYRRYGTATGAPNVL